MTILVAVLLSALASLVLSLAVASHICKKAAKSCKYASAVWIEKEQRWEVTGSYLTIASRIHKEIKNGGHRVHYKDTH